MKEELIAPCGMNCSLCVAYRFMKGDVNKQGFRKTYCPGCLPRGEGCLHMGDQCEQLRIGAIRFCYTCGSFPCRRLKALDRRYRTKYHMSMIANLEFIRDGGLAAFLQQQGEEWRCPECGGVICCHNGLCLDCQLDKLKQNKQYRWNEA